MHFVKLIFSFANGDIPHSLWGYQRNPMHQPNHWVRTMGCGQWTMNANATALAPSTGIAVLGMTKCGESPSATKCHQVSPGGTRCHQVSPSATKCHQVSPSVAKCHQVSPSVAKCHQPGGVQGTPARQGGAKRVSCCEHDTRLAPPWRTGVP